MSWIKTITWFIPSFPFAFFWFWVDFYWAFAYWVSLFREELNCWALKWEMGNGKWLYHVGKFECWDVWYGFMVIHQLYPVQIGYTAILGSGVGLVLLQLILLCTNFLNFCSTQRDFLSALWLSGLATHVVNTAFVIILWALI